MQNSEAAAAIDNAADAGLRPTMPAPEGLDGLPVPRRHWAHLVVALAVSMSVLDSSIANVALPTIARDLHSTADASIWVINGFQLALCMALLVLGSLGDIFGYERIYRYSLILFTLASLGCAVSTTLGELSVARFVQGLGGAGMIGVNNAMLRRIYPRAALPVGIGRNTLVVATALALGPSIASLILSVATWPYLFAVNVPIGIAALMIGARVLPPSRRSDQKFDGAGAGLSIAGCGLLVLAIEQLGHGEGDVLVLVEAVLGPAAGVVLIWWQKTAAAPILPVDLLRIRLFALSVGTTFLASMAQAMAYVAIPFLFQQALGRSQVETGFLITPWPVMVGLIAPVAGRLATRFSAGLLSSAGLAVLATALLLLAMLPPDAGTLDIAWRMLLAGAGYGLFLPPNASTQIGSVPKARSGGASSMGATARVFGQAIGTAIVALFFRLSPGEGSARALQAASIIALVGVVISASRTVSRPR